MCYVCSFLCLLCFNGANIGNFALARQIITFFSAFIVFLQHKNKEDTMARPIKETPILTCEDAEAFVEEMERVDSLSEEARTTNRIKLLEEFQTIVKKIAVCL